MWLLFQLSIPPLSFTLDGVEVEVPDSAASLLDVMRDELGVRSAKDGCSPQGQCGCCTVWVDGSPRVSCVTPVRRVRGRTITTLEGLDQAVRDSWVEAFVETGASQCGFCTPGIIMRLAALRSKPGRELAPSRIEAALRAHLCRCTGWRTIVEAACGSTAGGVHPLAERDWARASQRATLEGRGPQKVGEAVVRGLGGFAEDTAPAGCLVAVPDGAGDWIVAETLGEARSRSAKVQGRNSTLELSWPLAVPSGDWALVLSTTWVEPAYLEPDASWCEPGGEPVSSLANGGAFGAKVDSLAARTAQDLANRHGRAVRVVMSREDAVRTGPKRPPVALGMTADGTGIMRVSGPGSGPGWDEMVGRIATVAPGLQIQFEEVAGPAVSPMLRGAGWVEAAVAMAALGSDDGRIQVTSPEGSRAGADIAPDGRLRIWVECGPALDVVTLRSYCIGAAHMALGWVRSEGICLDEAAQPMDLTMRSWGILKANETPLVEVDIRPSAMTAVNGSDAVFAAVAAAAWWADGLGPRWPTRRGTDP